MMTRAAPQITGRHRLPAGKWCYAAGMSSPETTTEKHALLWAVQRSQRYHSRRSSFFSRWNKATAFAGVVGGSAVFASLGAALPSWVGTCAAAAVVLISGADLVVGAADMARKHNDLRRRFCELESAMATAEKDDVPRWKAERLSIESDEPPTHVALNLLCHNELVHAKYGPKESAEHLAKMNWWKRITAHLFIWEDT